MLCCEMLADCAAIAECLCVCVKDPRNRNLLLQDGLEVPKCNQMPTVHLSFRKCWALNVNRSGRMSSFRLPNKATP